MVALAKTLGAKGMIYGAIKQFALMLSPSKHYRLVLSALLTVIVSLAAIPAIAAQSDQGILEIQIKDHRDAIGDFTQLNIIIDKLLISPKAGLKVWQTGWKELAATTKPVDLTRYVGKKTVRVFRGNMDAGVFDAFHLKLKSVDGVLKKTQKTAPVKNTIGPVKLSFTLPAKGETVLIIDLTVMDMSDHPPRGYELGLKGYELFTNGKLIQKVPPA
jgi:hypothetical protein